ncbi:hypothetical protein [Alteromonas ponticola]|uniref:Zinc ribbon domain-containing protein n=1 Tax=Alteromonas ponticola TaxID=2720613 RepID=A0ABX1R348_9ALTE|nr:hypothetical protein [Alteromonas ponticola]NMH60874.1 hypothetical protein [Alteromonas ponticola]
MTVKTVKRYFCPDCTHQFSANTDHDHTVIISCPKCKSLCPKRCLETSAINKVVNQRKSWPLIVTRVVAFEGKQGFEAAKKACPNQPFFTYPASHYFDTKNPVISGEVWLESSMPLYKNWEVAHDSPTNAGERLQDFVVVHKHHHSDNILYGYYLVITDEMRTFKANTYVCGECYSAANKNDRFCKKCLKKHTLTYAQLQNTKLLPVNQSLSRSRLTKQEFREALDLYVDTHVKLPQKEQKKRMEQLVAKRNTVSDVEFKGFRWLLNEGINTEIFVFEENENRFVVGHQTPRIPEILNHIQEKLEAFPYPHVIR